MNERPHAEDEHGGFGRGALEGEYLHSETMIISLCRPLQ